MEAEIPSLKGVPQSHFLYAVKEIQDRLKVLNSLSSYMEEVSETENSLNKSLLKVANQGFACNRSESFQNFLLTWDHIFRATTFGKAKQHSTFSTYISHHISKTFPEQGKNYARRVRNISTRVVALNDELRKAKIAHVKNIERYTKMVQETEVAIKNKDNGTDVEVADDNFMNRSFSKMLAKITPGEKKPAEKCRDMIKELEMQEGQILANTRRLKSLQTELESEIKKSLVELNEVEIQRYTNVKEGLNRFVTGSEHLVERLHEMCQQILTSIESIESSTEVSFLSQIFENASNESLVLSTVLPRASSGDSADDNSPSEPLSPSISGNNVPFSDKNNATNVNNNSNNANNINANNIESPSPSSSQDVDALSKASSILNRSEKFSEALENFRIILSRAVSFLLEISEVERGYLKTAQKVVEKHGFVHLLNTKSGALPANNTCADVLSTIESPSMRISWESTVQAFLRSSDLHAQMGEFFNEKVCAPLDVISRRSENNRKELLERQNFHIKKIEAVNASYAKVSQKLIKVQRDLKERRSTLKKAKEDYESGVVDESGESMTMQRESLNDINEETQVSALGSNNNSNNSDSNANRRGSVKMMSGFENLGNSLRSAKFSQVVGLETPLERINRIENRITVLEGEEEALIEALQAEALAVSSVSESSNKEMLSLMKNTRDLLLNDLKSSSIVMKAFVNWHFEMIDKLKTDNAAIRLSIKDINLQRDMQYFIKLVDSAAETNQDNEELFFDVVEIDAFEPIKSDIIDEEKKSLAGSGANNTVDETNTANEDDKIKGDVTDVSVANGIAESKVSDKQKDKENEKENDDEEDEEEESIDAPRQVVFDCIQDGVELSSLFDKCGVTMIGEFVFEDFVAEDVFKCYWLAGSGYGNFLDSEGDLEISYSEWVPLSAKVTEDVCKLNFTHCRDYSYSHPRTTMLMFGPKNAPGKQKQYLYMPCAANKAPDDPNKDVEMLKQLTPKKFSVLTMTQFDGIPMADVFKVLQYWTYETMVDSNSGANKVIAKVGIALHYVKSSMFKSQIFGGTKDELSEQVKKWNTYIRKELANFKSSAVSSSKKSGKSKSKGKSSSSATASMDSSSNSKHSDVNVNEMNNNGISSNVSTQRRQSIRRSGSNERLGSQQTMAHNNNSSNNNNSNVVVYNLFGLMNLEIPTSVIGHVALVCIPFLLFLFYKNMTFSSRLSAIDKKLENITELLNQLSK